MKNRIIIDTDIGGDIDDAFAICLAMQSPEIELLGVTTVCQATDKKAMMARKLLDLGGYSHVPVYAGEAKGMREYDVYGQKVDYGMTPRQYQDKYETYEGWQYGAVEYIIRTLEQEEAGTVTLVPIGPLTNLGIVFSQRPDLAKKVREIVVMGGAYYTNWCEYNFCADPMAAEIVMNCGAPIRACGTDVTFQCIVPGGMMAEMRKNQEPAMQMLCEMLSAWGDHDVMLHDPLALWTVFDPSVVEYEPVRVRVEYEGTWANGVCVVQSNFAWNLEPENVLVAKSVDVPGFLKKCMDRMIGFRAKK